MFRYIEQKELPQTIKDSISTAVAMRNSTKIEDALSIRYLIENLHKYRFHFPQRQKLISDAIFKIHDIAFYNHSDFMRQHAQVSTIFGFLRNKPNDMRILKELLKRMAMIKNPGETFSSFQILTQHILDEYQKQNYQTQDTNGTVAYRLKALLLMLSDNAKRNFDKIWVRAAPETLENVYPKVKGFSQNFAASTQKSKRSSCPIIPEAVVVYTRPVHAKSGSFSHNFD